MKELYFFIGLIPASTLVFCDKDLGPSEREYLNKGLGVRVILLSLGLVLWWFLK